MAESVSGPSGPSLAFVSASVCSHLEDVGVAAEAGVAIGQFAHARKGKRVVGAEFSFPQGQYLF
jgi:hypothetical protein